MEGDRCRFWNSIQTLKIQILNWAKSLLKGELESSLCLVRSKDTHVLNFLFLHSFWKVCFPHKRNCYGDANSPFSSGEQTLITDVKDNEGRKDHLNVHLVTLIGGPGFSHKGNSSSACLNYSEWIYVHLLQFSYWNIRVPPNKK